LTKLWAFENRHFVWGIYVARCVGKSNTNNLPEPTDLTENPYGKKKLVFNDATQKSARVVEQGIAIEFQPREPIFEKCPHLREKGGVLTKIWAHGE
jgi:hypothetical protein